MSGADRRMESGGCTSARTRNSSFCYACIGPNRSLLVHHPDFLTVAWERVRGNKGAGTAGVDRVIPAFIADDADIVAFLRHVEVPTPTHHIGHRLILQ
ncbi:hypothetical protein [Streptomyces sp. NBC_00063]|uniref:hypothetical protein n=1 Tax=Streptomyces sp. NBC_00063 TaxID=2975638 RepID=UPI003D74F3F4